MTSFVRKVARTVDLRLVAVGVAGLALFVALLPGVHPDAAVDVDISPEEAIARADSFLNVLGAEVGQVNRAVTLRRSQRVLSHLQEDRSLKDAVSTLRELAQSPIASHYYRVLYLDSGGFEMGSASEVRLTTDGRIIHLRLREDLRPAGDARALAETGNAPDTAATADYVFRADESSSESVRFFSRSREEADGETTLAVVDPVDLASHH
ncbi:MAG: hypothetical protein ACOCTG_01290, partial [Bacteroidota bacterium]